MSHSKEDLSRVTAASLLVALGIIYGDIGTSPLYVLKAIVGDRAIDEQLVLGGLSCVFWTLCFQTSIKYIWLTLQADNEGEGGIFSLFALIRKYNRHLVIPTILGATTLLADGIITPPISVASAVEGLTMVKGLEHIHTVPIVIGIITVLFLMQRVGTQKVGFAFGPMMVVWFSMLFIMGLYNLSGHWYVLKGLNPYYAYNLLVHYPQGFWLLGAVFLATTGAEALYSDLGHCGKKNIRITWVFVKICLMVNYMGQVSWVLGSAGTYLNGRNPFFEMMPSWFLLPGIFIATSAAIIASQALISGSYTLINEAINLNFWPRVIVRQPSESKGQIFIPSLNGILWFGCVLMILYFQSSAHMEAAYGLAITVTMMITTYLLSFFVIYKLHWNRLLAYSLISLFVIIEMSFFIANIKKFPEGGFITMIVSGVFFVVMYSIYRGRKITNRMTHFAQLGQYTDMIRELSDDDNIPKFSTHLIYLTKANFRDEIEEKIINSIFSKKPKRADVYWFVHINRTEKPYTLSYDVSELIDDKIIKITLDIGFRVQPRTELFFKKIVQDLVANKELNLHIRPDGSTKYNPEPDFKFVVLEKFMSHENEFSFQQSALVNFYFFLKKLGINDEKAFGLDKSDVIVEYYPLIYQSIGALNLVRSEENPPS